MSSHRLCSFIIYFFCLLSLKSGSIFSGNLHKWYFAPRGCGFLWVNPTYSGTIDPSIVSHNYNKDFKNKFYKQGTDDYSNFVTAGFAVSQYYPSIGGMVGTGVVAVAVDTIA